MENRRSSSHEPVAGRRQPAEFGHFSGNILLGKRLLLGKAGQFAHEARHLDEVDRRRPLRKDVLGDLGFDPRLPLASAPLAGEIGRREEGHEESRFR